MFKKLLEDILKDHPLLGLEKDDQVKGHLSGPAAPAWIEKGPIYEIFVRNFSSKGTFAGVRDKIPYLKDLGIQTLWLMPIFPTGSEARKGTLGSPYSIKDYTSIDPANGSDEDLKNLIRHAHEQGLRVILDLVANHMAVDNKWRDQYPQYFQKDEEGKITRKIPEWSDVIDLDYNDTELREQMRQVIRYWIEYFDFDGFRCDVAGLVPLDFWEMVHKDLVSIKSDIFLLAEWESSHLHINAFHASYDWSTIFVLQDIFQGKRPASDAITWIMEKEKTYPRNALPMRFTENHDLERTREKFGKDSFYPFVLFNFISYGIPLIYCGQEFGLKRTPSLFDADPLDWDQFDDDIFGFYKTLILLRKEYPALASRNITNIWNDKPDQIVSILKKDNDHNIMVLLNFSQHDVKFKMDITDIGHNFETAVDLFSGETVNSSDLGKMRINPYGYYIYKSTNYTN
jgi:glycosidase